MLKESVSGCQLSIRQVQQAITTRKVSYTLACDHSHVYESHSAIDFHDNYVGPLNVINEHMKCKKIYGRNSKGESYTFQFVTMC